MKRVVISSGLLAIVLASACTDPDVKLRGEREPVASILDGGSAESEAQSVNQARPFKAPKEISNSS